MFLLFRKDGRQGGRILSFMAHETLKDKTFHVKHIGTGKLVKLDKDRVFAFLEVKGIWWKVFVRQLEAVRD